MENLSHIELTEEETDAAILAAKQRKEAAINYREQLKRIEERRKQLTDTGWDYLQTRNFMLYRAESLFEGRFRIDSTNELIFNLLCSYFSNDTDFLSIGESIGVPNPSLDKGILLAGNVGTGKTWLMRLFQKNKKNCYLMHNAKEIAAQFQAEGQEAIIELYENKRNAYNDSVFFFQPFAGLCIDDVGTEEIKNNFGNRSNVIGDLIETRYQKKSTGKFLHITTNLNAEGILNFYGARVASRMNEIFNIIELKGNDRRK